MPVGLSTYFLGFCEVCQDRINICKIRASRGLELFTSPGGADAFEVFGKIGIFF
jgi:hypothetical protein